MKKLLLLEIMFFFVKASIVFFHNNNEFQYFYSFGWFSKNIKITVPEMNTFKKLKQCLPLDIKSVRLKIKKKFSNWYRFSMTFAMFVCVPETLLSLVPCQLPHKSKKMLEKQPQDFITNNWLLCQINGESIWRKNNNKGN